MSHIYHAIIGGSLFFDDEQEDITLNAEYILIVDGGTLQIGTEDNPYTKLATIMMHGHWRSTELPLYGAKTLAVRNGTLDLHGKLDVITVESESFVCDAVWFGTSGSQM